MRMLRKMVNQMVWICFGLLVWSGVFGILNHETGKTLPWHFPLTFLLVGLLGALAQLLFLSRRDLTAYELRTRTALHILVLIGILCVGGWLFGWYATVWDNLIAILVFLIVYALSWLGQIISLWRDERRINAALKDFHEREKGAAAEIREAGKEIPK